MSTNTLPSGIWTPSHRPGYFGRKRDEKVKELNEKFGEGNWKLGHLLGEPKLGAYAVYDFVEACKMFYEESYFLYFRGRPEDVDYACQFQECYDNAETNVQSGLDYAKQEAYSNHIQDIALRNVLRRLGKWFTGAIPQLMQVRSKDTAGARFSPYNVPFAWPDLITQPSMAPEWAPHGTVEDFWQSNKWVLVRK